MKPSAIIREEIAALSAYHVQPASGLMKLDAMENPYDFPAHLQERLLARLSKVSLNRYPAADAPELKTAIRRAMQIPDELDIMLPIEHMTNVCAIRTVGDVRRIVDEAVT